MREFVYFSSRARTTGNFNLANLMEAGRMDIVCNVIISAFFLSHDLRQDVKLHLIFNGPPDAPKHLIFQYHPEMPISKKDVAGLIRRMLFKYKKGRMIEAFPGCSIEKKSFADLIGELEAEGKRIFLLDKKGADIRQAEILNNTVFIFGDHEGIPKHEMRHAKHLERVSVGPLTYFASQTIVIVNNELDRRQFS